jgi:hypothetical protein
MGTRADTSDGGGVTARGREHRVVAARVACRRYDPTRAILAVDFLLSVEDEESGVGDEIDGVACCRIRVFII